MTQQRPLADMHVMSVGSRGLVLWWAIVQVLLLRSEASATHGWLTLLWWELGVCYSEPPSCLELPKF